MTPEQEAFIHKHQSAYSYAVIAEHRKLWAVEQPTNPVPVFSVGQHNEYGYDGVPFGFRDSPNSVFYTTYGKTGRSPDPLRVEVDRALVDIANTYGVFTILADDTLFSRGMRAAAWRLGLDFEELRLDLEGHPSYEITKPVSFQRRIPVSQEEFLDHAERFGQITFCRDPLTIFWALAAERTEYPVIYPTFTPHLRNVNYDRVAKNTCGPPYWVFQESEDNYAIHRYLHAIGKPGIPSFWRYTPDLMAAFFNNKKMRQFIAGYPNDDASRMTDRNTRRMLLRAFKNPELKEFRSPAPNVLAYPELRRIKYEAKQRAFAGYLEVTGTRFHAHQYAHHIPLHRLLDHLGLKYDFPHGKYAEIYGEVA
jgi:hypothetical protein